MDIGTRLAQLEKRLRDIERSARLSSASLDDTALEVRDGNQGLRALIGQQADGTTAANIVNGPPPPAPTTPIALPVLGGVAVSWDGLFEGGAVLPLDWQRLEVHASATNGFTPDTTTLRSTIETPRGATVIVPTDDPVYVRLTARSTSGTPSTPSTQAGPYGPAPVVASDILDGIVTTIKLADAAVTAAKVKIGAIGADQLALGIGNLAPDPSFEGIRTTALIAGLPDWTLTTPGNNSPQALHVDCTAGAPSWKNIELGAFPVLPGERHFLALDYRVSAGFDGTGAKLLFRYEDATAAVTGYGVADETPTLGGAWDRATAQVLAPTGTVRAVLLVEASEVTTGWAEFDNLEVRTVIAGGMVVAGSIGANEITALAINAGHLAADAVSAGKIAADAVTAREIQALAITTGKLDANAVTTAKLAAGSVDATALKADAITGKTITGGEIIGSVIHTATSGERLAINEAGSNAFEVYDSAGRLVGVIDGAGLRLIGTNASEIGIDPDDAYPNVYLTSDDGTQRAVINVFGSTASDAGIGMNSGQFTSGAITDWKWRTLFGRDSWTAERIRNSDQSYSIGGKIALGNAVAQLHYINSTDTTQNTVLGINPNFVQLNGGRIEVIPTASNLSALFTNAASGHTGNMMRLQLNLVDRFVVDNTGNGTFAGDISAGDTTWTSYTPTVAGAGSATWSVRDGWYKKIGKMVYVEAYIAFSAAGTGTGTVTVTLPSTPYRGSANRRQYLPTCTGGMVAGTNANVGGVTIGNINTSGSGAVIDQLRGPTDILYRGDNFSATATITINGWYREA